MCDWRPVRLHWSADGWFKTVIKQKPWWTYPSKFDPHDRNWMSCRCNFLSHKRHLPSNIMVQLAVNIRYWPCNRFPLCFHSELFSGTLYLLTFPSPRTAGRLPALAIFLTSEWWTFGSWRCGTGWLVGRMERGLGGGRQIIYITVNQGN